MAVERHLRALEAAIEGPMTLGELAHKLHHAGFGFVVIVVCLPFLQPIPLGGLSTVLGPFVALQGVRLLRGEKELHLPGWIARRSLEAKTLQLLLGVATRFFHAAEKVCRRRWQFLLTGERAAGAGIALSGALLSLPFPIPLSNIVCALPAVLLALSDIEDDGLLAVLGWLGVLVSIAFHIGVALLGFSGVKALLS